MDKVIENYLRNNTLEQITKDWNEQQELSNMNCYKGWITYIIDNRKEPICNAIWSYGLGCMLNDQEFNDKVQSGDRKAFSELKDKAFNVLVKDGQLLGKLYKTGTIKEKRELFKKERTKWYL